VVAVLDALEAQRAHAVIGASYGGMVALALTDVAPDRLARGVVISAAERSHPMSTALRSLQRRVVRLGVTSGHATEAVAIARGIAMTTYRTAPEFAARFGGDGTEPSASLAAVDGYLAYQGERFARRFDPGAFLRLSESLDLHHVVPATIRAPLTLVAVDSDTLVPPSQIRALHERLGRLGRPSSLVEIQSPYGHDAFLKERAAMASILNAALTARGHR
jgi:homoserine O-acetyltransferase